MDPAEQQDQDQVIELSVGPPYPSLHHRTYEPLAHLSNPYAHQFQTGQSFVPPSYLPISQYPLAPPFPYPPSMAQPFTANVPMYPLSTTGIPKYPYTYPPIQPATYIPNSPPLDYSTNNTTNNTSAYLLDQPAPHTTNNSLVDSTRPSASQCPPHISGCLTPEPPAQTICPAMLQYPMAETLVIPSQSAPHAVSNEFSVDPTGHGVHQSLPQHQRRKNFRGSRRTQGTSGAFRNAHHFVVNNPVMNEFNDPDYSMKEFAGYTIPGAAFDSSARDPPPRCHPGTRLSILQRIQVFIADRTQDQRMFWLVGPAGVGKSAIMQTLAENTSTIAPDLTLGASLFFSINGCNDGSKTVPTLAYQLAVNNPSYRQFIQDEMANDPLLLQKSMSVQFNKFIVEPFVHRAINPHGKRFLILIDGLDECNDEHSQGRHTQRTILGLISYFSTTYPNAPFIWIVASRPEPHITSFLSLPRVVPSYKKEEIIIDSDESREDVERYLRDELDKLRTKYPALMSHVRWPAEHDFLKLAAAANGLFAYAFTAVSFIDDPIYANPASQLKLVLEVIDNVPSRLGEGNVHPMANLDALYSRILFRIPRNIFFETRKLLLSMASDNYFPFAKLCDWLGMTWDVAYSALHHLYSVLEIPSPEKAFRLELAFRHKSFSDYIYDFNRSGMFPDVDCERKDIESQCLKRIFNEVSKAGIGTGSDPSACISLSWESRGCRGLGEDLEILSNRQDAIYCHAMVVLWKYLFGEPPNLFENSDWIRLLKLIDLRLLDPPYDNIYQMFQDHIMQEYRYSRLRNYHVVDMIPIGRLDMDNIVEGMQFLVDYWTKNPALEALPDIDWCDSCQYSWEEYRGTLTNQGERWLSAFPHGCKCVEHILQAFKHGHTHTPDHLVAVYADIRNFGWIDYKFVDDDDELSRWSYTIPYQFPSAIGV